MLLAALKLQLAALVSVAGIDTADIKSPDVTKALETLSAATKSAADGKTDINQASTEAVKAIKELADKGDADASYALALWARLGVINGLDAKALLGLYDRAAQGGNVPAKAELGGLLIQNFPQDLDQVKKGITLIQEAEGKGNAAARRALAQLTLSGVPAAGLERSIPKALELLEKGSAGGDGEATYTLGRIYAAGIQERQQDGSATDLLKRDEAKALDFLKKAADQEFAPAMNDLGTRLLLGEDKDGKNKDPKAAMAMFNKAADKGNAAAHRLLAQVYENGLGDQAKSIDEALKHYLTAARGNDGVAQLWVGNASQTGLLKDSAKGKKQEELKPEDVLVAPNPSQALTMYRLAAQNNLPQAIYNVGVFYENGAVVDKDLTKAFALVQRAAQAGIPVAAYRLGAYYQQGAGVGQDVVAAAAWYKRAADAGLPEAKLVYGIMLENGAGVEASVIGAAKNYEEAADAGLPQAMVNLAQLYERGAGVSKNIGKAWTLTSLAIDASNGDANAKAYREKLEKALSKDELDKAKKDYEDKKAKLTSGAAPAPAAEAPPASTGKGKGKAK